MKALLALGLVLATTATAAAAGIRTYDVRVRVAPSGTTEVTAVLRLTDAAGTLRIPAGFSDVSEVRLIDGPAGTLVAAEPAGTQTTIRIVLPESAPTAVTLSLAFRAGVVLKERAGTPGAPRLLRHALLNSQPDPIDIYTVRVALPSGSRAHAVREALPARRPADSQPRVALSAADGTNELVLRVAPLAQGETASMQVETASTSRSPIWMIAGAALALLYLVRFRDLVAPAPHSDTRVP